MTGCYKKDVRFCATLTAVVLLCLITCEVNAEKNGFRGGAKSYEIHVEASAIGTNLHYQLPEAKVKAAGKAKQGWLVDNDNAEMISMNSPVLAVVSVKHPKFSTKGQWPGYKLKFKVPKGVSESGAKKMNFLRPATSERQTASFIDKDESSGIEGSASGSGSGLNFPQNEEPLTSKLPNSKPKQEAQSVRKLAGSPVERNPRETITDELSKRLGFGKKSGLSLQKVSGLLLPLEKLKNLRLKNPAVKKEMETIVTHAKKVVSEAKTVLNDAASFVDNVRSLVMHGGRNIQLNGIADYARKAVEEVGSSKLGLLRESIAIAKGSADTATLRTPTKLAGLHVSQLGEGSGKSTKETEKDADSVVAHGRRVATKTFKPSREAKAPADVINGLNNDGSSSENSQPKTTGEIRKRRESSGEREDVVESFFSSLENLKDLLGLHRK